MREVPGGDPGHLAGPVPVDGEQHGTEYDAVVRVELAADRGDQLVARPGRVLVPPGRDGGAGPGQVRGVVVPEPHGRLRGLLLNSRRPVHGGRLLTIARQRGYRQRAARRTRG